MDCRRSISGLRRREQVQRRGLCRGLERTVKGERVALETIKTQRWSYNGLDNFFINLYVLYVYGFQFPFLHGLKIIEGILGNR